VLVSILFVLQYLNLMVTGYPQMLQKLSAQFAAGNYDYLPTIPQIGLSARLLDLAISLMVMMLSTGFTIFCLNTCNGVKASFGNLFDGFAIFFKVLWLEILIYFFTLLWTFLLIIPGIVAGYRYRMALFIMIENPQMSALECINASKSMMQGHKGELFVLDLSFVGWQMLTIIPFVSLWVTPYLNITLTHYYLALRDMPVISNY
ncbi:MAG: DUF975 family protein, partial [Oscillospiraceae bacterium]